MQAFVTLNGKKVGVTLTQEQVEALVAAQKEGSPFKRSEQGEKYFVADVSGVGTGIEAGTNSNDLHWAAANYFADKSAAEQVVLNQLLYRKLTQFALEHKALAMGRKANGKSGSYTVVRGPHNALDVSNGTPHEGFGVRFTNKNVAVAAISLVVLPFLQEHPNFKW